MTNFPPFKQFTLIDDSLESYTSDHTEVIMDIETLIAKQQLEIEELKENEALYKSAIHSSIMLMICIGGPLNDNVLMFTKEQRVVFHKIKDYLEEV